MPTGTKRKSPPIDIRSGSAPEVLRSIPAGSIHLIVTNPPYADARSGTYGEIEVDRFVDWFLEISFELHRVLRSDGSFILNIKEPVVNGERAIGLPHE